LDQSQDWHGSEDPKLSHGPRLRTPELHGNTRRLEILNGSRHRRHSLTIQQRTAAADERSMIVALGLKKKGMKAPLYRSGFAKAWYGLREA